MNKKYLNVFILFILIISFFGCQKKIDKYEKRNNLRINCSEGIPPSLHPHIASNSHNVTICKALFECLTRINLKNKIECAAAEKIEISPCKKKYLIKLRSTVWSNGKKVTSKHFANAWRHAISLNSKCAFANHFFFIKNAKNAYLGKCPLEDVGIFTPSNKELIIELEHPAPYFLQLLADPLFAPIYGDLNKEPIVFNGPFKIHQPININQQLILISNPLYWDFNALKIKHIEISFISDPSTTMTMYKKNKLDWIGSPLNDITEESLQNNSEWQIRESLEPFWLYCNTENIKLKSPKIRQALSLSVERNLVEKYILKFQKSSFTILPSEISLIKENLLSGKNAKALFHEGLKEINISIEKFQLSLSYINSQRHERLAHFLKQTWEKTLGISINLKKIESTSFFSQMRSGNYELGGYCVISTYEDPIYFFDKFESKNLNISKWENLKFQKYLSLAKQASSIKKRNQYLKEAEEIITKELPVIPIYNHTHVYLCQKTLKNLIPPKLAYIDFKWTYFDE